MAMPISFVFSRYHESALSAADEPGEREIMLLRGRLPRAAQELPDALKLGHGDHRRMRAPVRLSAPDQDAGVEGIGEYPIDAARG